MDAICEKKDKNDPQGTRVDIKAKHKVYMIRSLLETKGHCFNWKDCKVFSHDVPVLECALPI